MTLPAYNGKSNAVDVTSTAVYRRSTRVDEAQTAVNVTLNAYNGMLIRVDGASTAYDVTSTASQKR
jgi:hypothetical protein